MSGALSDTFSLAGRTVLVTGAGGGVGRGVALACAAAGAQIVVASPRENGEETVALVNATGGTARWIRCDVTVPAEVHAAVAAAVERTGRLDAMVHNATSRRSGEPARLETADDALLDEHMAVSLRATFHCATAALPHLRESAGAFVTMTSPAGMEGSFMLPLYGTVKAALRGFTKSVAREWAPFGIRVNTVSPLAVTPALAHAYREDPGLEARTTSRVPLGRIGDPATDIGPAVAFLLGDGARYVTGQTLVVDGGRFMNL
jgi:NAD(P)-dependent dehydrogenase (short-subunit alcohol dehydrogenase family)